MSSEEEKGIVELAVFFEFVAKTQMNINFGSVVKSGKPSQPDIFLSLTTGENISFELVELCASDVAVALSKQTTGAIVGLWTSDPTATIVRRKLRKKYETDTPIELLCYTAARLVSTDQAILATILRLAESIDGPFRKIWLLGENGVHEVWPTAESKR